MRQRQAIGLLAALLLAIPLAGCALSNSSSSAVAVAMASGDPPPVSMGAGATAVMAAIVMNDPANQGLEWSVVCNGASCGAFAPPVTASGAPTTYHAPSSVPAGGTVTVTARSISNTSKSISATITVTSTTTSLNDGTYVFHLNGTDSTWDNGTSPYYIAGAFTVSGGAITGGEQDFVDYNTVITDTFDPSASSIQLSSDGNLAIVLATAGSDWNVGVNGVETINAALVDNSRALVIEFDSFGSSTGSLEMQSGAPVLPSRGYAFSAAGIDLVRAPLGIGGVVNIDGAGSISGNGSVFDINDAGVVSQGQTLDSGTVSAPDSFGRIQIHLTPGVDSGVPGITFIGYVVDSNTIRVVEGEDNLMATLGGTLIGQGSSTGAFSNTSISNSSYVTGAEGSDANGPLQLAGVLSFEDTGNGVAGNISFNDVASQVVASDVVSGNFTIDATGRVTVSGLSGGGFGPATFQLYLDGNGNALLVSMDSSDVTAGSAFLQTSGSPFAGSYAMVADGTSPAVSGDPVWSAVGTVSSDGTSGIISGFSDYNVLATSLAPNTGITGTASASGGVLSGTMTGLNSASGSSADNFVFYVIDGSRLFAIETDNAQLGLGFFQN